MRIWDKKSLVMHLCAVVTVLVASAAPAAPANAAAHGVKVEFELDCSKAPGKAKWAKNNLVPYLERSAARVIRLLDGKNAVWNRGSVKIIVDPGCSSPAAANAQGKCIWLSPAFMDSHPHEVPGALIHEFTHVVQNYGPEEGRAVPYASVPGWITEGIADWVRWFNFEGPAGVARATGDAQRNPKHDAAYGVSASFFDYIVKKYDRQFVVKLNRLCRDGRYSEEVWVKLTGKSRDALAGEWRRKIK